MKKTPDGEWEDLSSNPAFNWLHNVDQVKESYWPIQSYKIRKLGNLVITGLHMITSGPQTLMSFFKLNNSQIPPCLHAKWLHHTLFNIYILTLFREEGEGKKTN